MLRLLAACLALTFATPAWADTLLDNVDGVTLDRDGKLARFSGLLIDNEGRIAAVLQRRDKRPRRTDYVIDGKGRFVIPGLIDSHIRLMPVALAALAREADGQVLPQLQPLPRPEDRDVAFGKVQRLLAARGVTAVADMGTTIEDWQTYRRAGDKGMLYLRIMAYAADIPAMALIAGPRPTPWLYDDHLRAGGLHLALDGPLESREAALKAPYADRPGASGSMLTNDTQLRNLMSRAAMDGFQLAVTAHGDAATSATLGAYTELSLTYGSTRRWRIEAVQLADPADTGIFGKLGVIASLSPARLAGDAGVAETRLGPTRLGEVQPWRSLAQAGAKLVFGSGGGTAAQPPFAGIAAAISREGEDGQPFGGWQPQERLVDRVDALAAYSADGAFAGFADGRFGRLVAGERADFLLLDSDPLLTPLSDLRGLRVLETWIGGQKIYDAAAPEASVKAQEAPPPLPDSPPSPPASR